MVKVNFKQAWIILKKMSVFTKQSLISFMDSYISSKYPEEQ